MSNRNKRKNRNNKTNKTNQNQANRQKQPDNLRVQYDALEVVGSALLNTDKILSDYIKNNAIQVKAPIPATAQGAAMDSECSGQQYPASFDYVNSHVLSYYIASCSFIGYYAMSVIAQNDLVMIGCSSAATDAMKKGYELSRNDGEDLDKKELRAIRKLDKQYKLNQNIIEGETFKNVFGIRHILFKHTDPNFDYSEPFNAEAFKGGKYAGMSQIDPYWVTPELADNDITDPTAINYYEPTFWLISGKRYHKSHFVILTGDPVADYLKPTYRYGGISMTQKVYERVYAGERTANEIPQLAMTKRMNVIKTDLEKAQANKQQFVKNLNTMNKYRDNYGVKVIGKDEEYDQLETALTDLDKAMWANYHLVAAIFRRPVSKIFGTGFGGLGTGETDDDYDISMLEALQASDLEDIAYAHYERMMMSEFNEEMDLDIVWNPLKVISEKEQSDINFQKSQAALNEWNIGAISEVDERDRLISDKHSGYSGMPTLEEVDYNEKDDNKNNPDAMDGYAEDFVREEDGKWFVFSESGKRLSKGYETKEEAYKRLEQIEYFKHEENK